MECPYCERRCQLGEEQLGYCKMYTLSDGKVVELFPHRYSSLFVTHIESVPFYHFQPGSRTLVLGGAGCNFDCQYCSNAYVARSDPEPLLSHELSPQRVVALAKQSGCHNLAFAVNEPTVALPTLLELARVAHAEGLPLGVLSNGYMQADAAAAMGEAFRFINISIKAGTDGFYQGYVGVRGKDIVARNLGILAAKTHVEVSTPIVQGLNDADIPELAALIGAVDRRLAWHVFRLLPEYKMASYQRPPIEAVSAALQQARSSLDHIYFDNFVGSRWVSTLCPRCGATAVERINLGGCGAKSLSYGLRGGCCDRCGLPLPIVGDPVPWNSKDGAPCM